MKPYGLPRCNDVSNPDCADMFRFGLKGSSGNLPNNSEGDIHNSVRSSTKKRILRRFWKKKARRSNKNIFNEEF